MQMVWRESRPKAHLPWLFCVTVLNTEIGTWDKQRLWLTVAAVSSDVNISSEPWKQSILIKDALKGLYCCARPEMPCICLQCIRLPKYASLIFSWCTHIPLSYCHEMLRECFFLDLFLKGHETIQPLLLYPNEVKGSWSNVKASCGDRRHLVITK